MPRDDDVQSSLTHGRLRSGVRYRKIRDDGFDDDDYQQALKLSLEASEQENNPSHHSSEDIGDDSFDLPGDEPTAVEASEQQNNPSHHSSEDVADDSEDIADDSFD